jgi:hypothetical protein
METHFTLNEISELITKGVLIKNAGFLTTYFYCPKFDLEEIVSLLTKMLGIENTDGSPKDIELLIEWVKNKQIKGAN